MNQQVEQQQAQLTAAESSASESKQYLDALATFISKQQTATSDGDETPSTPAPLLTGLALIQHITNKLDEWITYKQQSQQHLQMISSLQEQLEESGRISASVSAELAGLSQLPTEVQKYATQIATLQATLQEQQEKNAKMKTLLLRANKHIEQHNKKAGQTKASLTSAFHRITTLRNIISHHWLNMSAIMDTSTPTPTPSSTTTTTETEDKENKSDDIDFGTESMDEGIDVDVCTVVKRVSIFGVMWCLIAVARQHHDTDTNTSSTFGVSDESDMITPTPIENGNHDVDVDDSTQSESERWKNHIMFWVTQHYFLQLKHEKRLKKIQDLKKMLQATGDPAQFHTPIDHAKEMEKASNHGVVSLADGTSLPATLEHELTHRLNQKFDQKWSANSKHYQRTMNELTAKLESTERDLSRISDEYTSYKTRAHTVLAQQNSELVAANQQIQENVTLRSQVETLQTQVAQMEEEKKMFQPEQMEMLKRRLATTEREKEVAAEELNRLESEYKQKQQAWEQQMKSLNEKHAQELSDLRTELEEKQSSWREDLAAHRKKARDLIQTKDQQITTLQNKIKSMQGYGDAEEQQHTTQQTTQASDPLTSSVPNTPRETPAPAAVATPAPAPTTPSRATTSASTSAPQPLTSPATSTSGSTWKYDEDAGGSGTITPTDPRGSGSGATGSLMHLAAMQASRDEELQRHRLHIRKLQALLTEQEMAAVAAREREQQLSSQLKEAQRHAERTDELQKQDNIEYLKNVVVRYMETGDHKTLAPVLSMLLRLSPAETERIEKKRAESKGFFTFF